MGPHGDVRKPTGSGFSFVIWTTPAAQLGLKTQSRLSPVERCGVTTDQLPNFLRLAACGPCLRAAHLLTTPCPNHELTWHSLGGGRVLSQTAAAAPQGA